MARWPFQYTNINGIPTIQTKTVKVNTDTVNFGFRPDWDRNPFRGLILVYLSEEIPEGTTTTLPITFTMAGNTSNVTLPDGNNLTVADVNTGSVYLVYYDRLSNILQVITV